MAGGEAFGDGDGRVSGQVGAREFEVCGAGGKGAEAPDDFGGAWCADAGGFDGEAGRSVERGALVAVGAVPGEGEESGLAGRKRGAGISGGEGFGGEEDERGEDEDGE